MLARPFEWRDLPYLHAFREQTLFLDSALVLTRGPLQVLGAMLSAVLPSAGLFTAVSQDERHPRARLMGQIMRLKGAPVARLVFLSPERFAREDFFAPLLNILARQAAAGNALRLLAETESDHGVFPLLRKGGFVPYGKQRIWRLSPETLSACDGDSLWRMARGQDAFAVQQLYARVAPPSVQQVFPRLPDAERGLVYARDGLVSGYAALQYGLRGVFVRPLLQPDLDASVFRSMLGTLASPSFLRDRPLYIGVTAGQGWLESILETLNARPGPEQTLLVKHLTAPFLRQTKPLLHSARQPGPIVL